jgi:hypothetical protein
MAEPVRVPGGGAFGRSARRDVRNPILALPAARLAADFPPEQRRVIGGILRDLAKQARGKAAVAWDSRKGIMAAYWQAVAVYSNHIARVIDPRSPVRD